ncbi:MAG: hypothetical protein AB7E31_15100 [Desulfitobacterium sp.]
MAVGLISIPSVMDMYDTHEMFSRYYVDPVIAQQHVPSKWKVKIHENGKAFLYVWCRNAIRWRWAGQSERLTGFGHSLALTPAG